MKNITVEIITPERRTVKTEDVEFAVIPGYSGELGILPGHMEILALLSPGEVRIQTKGETSKFVIASGFASVGPESVKVFTTLARPKT